MFETVAAPLAKVLAWKGPEYSHQAIQKGHRTKVTRSTLLSHAAETQGIYVLQFQCWEIFFL